MPKATQPVHAAGLWGPHRHLMDLLSLPLECGASSGEAARTAGGHLYWCWERVGVHNSRAACPQP